MTCAHGRACIHATRATARWLAPSRIAAFLVLWLIAGPAVGFGQTAAPDVWPTAVDRYLSGGRDQAASLLLASPASELVASSRRAFAAWTPAPAGDADARRQLLRRLQASALLPLEVLVAVTGRTLNPAYEAALEDAGREAWRRLDAFDDEDDGAAAAQVRRFRTWWRLGHVQHLIASGRFRDVPREAMAVHPPADDPEAVATLALLRGLALETRARLADEAPGANVAVSMRRLSTPSRLGPMLLAMDDAGKQYRRALEVSPDDREATLRLGRVALERDRLDEAERVLTPLLPGACRDAICGLAHLFMGEVHEARSQPDRAASAYARASAVPALRHTALVAMMQASLRRGNAGGAFDLTRQFGTPAALAARQPADAWTIYAGGQLVEGTRILATLGETVVP